MVPYEEDFVLAHGNLNKDLVVTLRPPEISGYSFFLLKRHLHSSPEISHYKMQPSKDEKAISEKKSDPEISSDNTDLGDASGFIGHGEALVLDEKASRKLLWKIGKNAPDFCLISQPEVNRSPSSSGPWSALHVTVSGQNYNLVRCVRWSLPSFPFGN